MEDTTEQLIDEEIILVLIFEYETENLLEGTVWSSKKDFLQVISFHLELENLPCNHHQDINDASIILDILLSKDYFQDRYHFLRLTVNCSLCYPIDQVTRVSLEKGKDRLIELLVSDDSHRQLSFDISQIINSWRESVYSAYQGILGIIETVH